MTRSPLAMLTAAVRAVVRIDAGTLLVIGALAVAGGPARFGVRSYETQADIAPGWAWGLAAIVGGVLVLAGSLADERDEGRRLASWGLYAGAAWTGFFAAAFVVAAVQEVLQPGPNLAPLLGIAIYGGPAFRMSFLAAIVRQLHGAGPTAGPAPGNGDR